MKLFADSGCDLPKEYFGENDVHLIPLRVNINNVEYEDIVELNAKQVYDDLRGGGQPKTSQASPEIFLRCFEELAQNNEEGLYISLSSQLSGTYSTAVMIAEQVRERYPDLNLILIDSKCVSLGYGFLVKEAVALRSKGLSGQEIAQHIQRLSLHMSHLFTVEDLKYLAAGGRLSKTSALVGGILSIKPILQVEDGKLVPLEKTRGRKKAIARIIEMAGERGANFQDQTIGISHADDLEFANEVKQLIEEKLNPKAIEMSMVGSAVGAHAGPGTIAVFFVDKEYYIQS